MRAQPSPELTFKCHMQSRAAGAPPLSETEQKCRQFKRFPAARRRAAICQDPQNLIIMFWNKDVDVCTLPDRLQRCCFNTSLRLNCAAAASRSPSTAAGCSFAVAHILTNPIKAAATVKAQSAAMQMTYLVTLCQEVKRCDTCGHRVAAFSIMVEQQASVEVDPGASTSNVFLLTLIHILDREAEEPSHVTKKSKIFKA